MGYEGCDLTLTVDDESDGDALHTPCRERGTDALPQYGRELEAHDTVEDAACLLRIDKIHVHLTWVLQSMEEGFGGDLVEDDTAGLLWLELEGFAQMPSDGFSFAVFIGSEVDEVGFLCCGFEFAHQALLVLGDDVLGAEVILYIHAEGMLLEVTHMARTGHDLIVVQLMFFEKARDQLGLLRRLYYN